MRKGWKVFWVMCISLAVLGIALCISGVLLGATAQGIREAFGVYRMGADEADEIADSYYTEEKHTGDLPDIYSRDSSAGEYAGKGQQFSQIEELEVDVTCLEVYLNVWDENEIRVDTDGVEKELLDDLVITSEDRELKIQLKNRSKWDKIGNTGFQSRGTLQMYIPSEQELEEASVKVGAGILNADYITARELDIEVGAGQVYLSDFTVGELDVECGAGEADLYGEAERKVSIECGVGRVSYTAAGSQEDYDYEVSCGIGSVTVGSDSYSGLGGERKVKNSGSRKMEIECGIGMVDVSFED